MPPALDPQRPSGQAACRSTLQKELEKASDLNPERIRAEEGADGSDVEMDEQRLEPRSDDDDT